MNDTQNPMPGPTGPDTEPVVYDPDEGDLGFEPGVLGFAAPKRILSAGEKADMVARVQAGERQRDIAAIHGVQQATVSRVWRESGQAGIGRTAIDGRPGWAPRKGKGNRPAGEVEARYQALAQLLKAEVTRPDGSIRPIQVRRFGYRLTALAGYTKDDFDGLGDDLVAMRERGIIPYSWISDSTRGTFGSRWATDGGSYIDGMVADFELDLMAAQGVVVEVWAESYSIATSIAPAMDVYGIPVRYMRGQDTTTGIEEAARRIVEGLKSGKPVFIGSVGDFDKSGLDIHESLVERLHTHTWAIAQGLTVEAVRHTIPGVRVKDLSVERLALTEQQIRDHGLMWIEWAPKYRDEGVRDWLAKYPGKVETEALDTADLIAILRDWVEDHIDLGIWGSEIAREQEERDRIERIAAAWADDADDADADADAEED